MQVQMHVYIYSTWTALKAHNCKYSASSCTGRVTSNNVHRLLFFEEIQQYFIEGTNNLRVLELLTSLVLYAKNCTMNNFRPIVNVYSIR